MPVLTDYHQFNGRHPETGSVHNILAYQGVTAPHTGEPYSEALLLGVSGGIAFGYFTFDYHGYPPILSLLTRNTFDPLQTMLKRMGVPQTVLQANRAETGEQNLLAALDNGRPALVWADQFSLPYNGLPYEERNWDMQPLVVYGLEDGTAWVADRSGLLLEIPWKTLTTARARIKKEKFRVITLDPPEERKLPAAVQQGLWQCLRLYTEKPPKGARDNFGFAALQKWARLLVNTRNPQGWARFFPPGPRLLAALAGSAYLPGAYGWIAQWGTHPQADRGTYADFLQEAAVVLGKPALGETAHLFRASGESWAALANALLPADLPLLGEARRLKDRRHRLFMAQGSAAQDELREINHQLEGLRQVASQDFPFTASQAAEFQDGLRQHVLRIHDQEQAAIAALQAALT